MLSRLPFQDIALFEPESNFLLGILNAVGAVAYVAAYVDRVVATDGAWCCVARVGGAEEDTTGFDGITAFPDHGTDWATQHVLD